MAILSLSPRINNACGKKCLSAPKWLRVTSIREGNLDSERRFSVLWIMEQSKWPKVPWKRSRRTAVCVTEEQLRAESEWEITELLFRLFVAPLPPVLAAGVAWLSFQGSKKAKVGRPQGGFYYGTASPPRFLRALNRSFWHIHQVLWRQLLLICTFIFFLLTLSYEDKKF